MKRLACSLILILIVFHLAHSQVADSLFRLAGDKLENDEFAEAIRLYSETIDLEPSNYYAWFNRGISKAMLRLYEDALTDVDMALSIKPSFKRGLLVRGNLKKELTDYNGALHDYSQAIALDLNYANAYYCRGLVFEMLSQNDSACFDFNAAYLLGNESAKRKADNCNDTVSAKPKYNSILYLTGHSKSRRYGFNSKDPVKVGKGPDGGPANQRAYLNLLRDKHGKTLQYERIGSCCAYKSENGLFGFALIDMYRITYRNKRGQDQNAIVYITFYDYEEPKILHGFDTIRKQ